MLEAVIGGFQAIIDACDGVTTFGGIKAICQTPALLLRVITETLVFASDVVLGISEQVYGEQATPSDQEGETEFIKGRQDAIYENVITNHGNIITTFKSTLQLKQLLGGVLDNQEEDEEGNDPTRRRLQSKSCVFEEIGSDCTCVLTGDSGYVPGCTKPACEDIRRLCNGAFNYKYIADQRQGEFSNHAL